MFERIDVLGISSVEITPTPEADACGWSDAFGEPVAISVKVKTGRGERYRAVMSDAGAVVHFVRERTAQTGARSA